MPRKLYPMTVEQEQHLQRIKTGFLDLVDAKYRDGQENHGGNLFDAPQRRLLDCAIEEAIDQVVYLLTLRESL